MVCICDHDQVIAAAGSGSKEYLGKRIHSELEDVIADRGNDVVTDKGFLKVVEDDRYDYSSQAYSTITCAGDSIGIVILLGREGGRAFTETELKLAQAASGFLGRQMEQKGKEKTEHLPGIGKRDSGTGAFFMYKSLFDGSFARLLQKSGFDRVQLVR